VARFCRFKARFKSLIDQYELRELHFHSAMRTKEIEVQWNMARYEQQKKTAEADAARARQLNSQVLTFTKTETELRNQLNVYVEKFKQVRRALAPEIVRQALTFHEVEDTLNNSNDLFLTFRKEMEDMSRKTKRLEKENEAYKRKNEKLNQNILKLADERTRLLKELGDLRRKTEKLTSIINQMQQQGRGIPQGMQGMLDSCAVESHPEGVEEHDLGDVDDEGSTYGEEEYDEDDPLSDDVGDYDDDTEEEILQPTRTHCLKFLGQRQPPLDQSDHHHHTQRMATDEGRSVLSTSWKETEIILPSPAAPLFVFGSDMQVAYHAFVALRVLKTRKYTWCL